jgi:hypothetical protein
LVHFFGDKAKHKVRVSLVLRSGDLVEVRSAADIIRSLDSNGTLDGLPFMPEMLELCRKRYRVYQRAVQVTIDGSGIPLNHESRVREFTNNDVVLLEDLRCSGLDHGGCQRGCRIFWKEAWLKLTEETSLQSSVALDSKEMLRSRLKTNEEPGIFFCQSSVIHRATTSLSFLERIMKCFSAVVSGNCGPLEMAGRLSVWSYWKARKKMMGIYPRGNRKPTPVESLGLRTGEMVMVKSLPEIIETLDKNGRNRGLHFSVDMIRFCGRQYRVRSRADRLITEATGEMRGIPNTVILEGVTCDGSVYAFGGCPRMDFQYWREIWLRRV